MTSSASNPPRAGEPSKNIALVLPPNVCIATVVTQNAIDAMLEAGGKGSYRDAHPWLIAQEILRTRQPLPILFAVQGDAPMHFSHWSMIKDIDVVELHRGQWESRCHFDVLQPINMIWEAIDSVFLLPGQVQLERELREDIRVRRAALDEHSIHPYAVCETPPFIEAALKDLQ